MTLKAFCYAGIDTIIARSVEDAIAVLTEMGCYGEDYEEDEWTERDLEEELLINFEDEQKSWPKGATIIHDGRMTAKIGEWVEWNGRGFLCSTEW